MNQNYNEVSDLGLAASLSAAGFAIARVDKTNPRRAVFVFKDSPNLRSTIELFWSGELRLPASTLLESIRKLKSRIYS